MRGILNVGALGILKCHNLKSMENSLKHTREKAQSSRLCTETDSETCQKFKIELLANIVNGFQPSVIFAKTIVDFLQGCEYASVVPAKSLPTF